MKSRSSFRRPAEHAPISDVPAPVMAMKLRTQARPLPGQLDLFKPPPTNPTLAALVSEGRVEPTAVSPNTGSWLSAAEAERVAAGRSARLMGRMILTNIASFGCQVCLTKFGTPEILKPNYEVVWEPRAGEGKKLTCEWCGKSCRGEISDAAQRRIATALEELRKNGEEA